jgi:hypothetical protein
VPRAAVLAASLALLPVGCGGEGTSAHERGRCRPATQGYELCGQPSMSGRGGRRSTIVRGDTVVAAPVERTGYWRKLFVSPDGKTLLAEWSGECELPTAFFVPTVGGRPRPVTTEWQTSRGSQALGWDGRRARVLLPRGVTSSRRPGVYLVDPRTLRATLVQPGRGTARC